MHQTSIQEKLPQIQSLMRQYGVQRASLFGSTARGDMHPHSDIDFLIAFPPEMDYITYGNNYFKLLYALQDLLATEVELVAEETITNPYLLESINRDKIVLL